MTVWILGAGASKAYSDSNAGIRMPIAKDFFPAYEALPLARQRWVIVGALINYLCEERGADIRKPFAKAQDIEELHSEIQSRLATLQEQDTGSSSRARKEKLHRCWGAYSELLFLFAAVVNEVQDGPVSKPHQNIVDLLGADDSVVTFNWDTLIDRALFESGRWNVDTGYGITPKTIRDEHGWRTPILSTAASPKILKLHGSTNWLTGAHTGKDGKVFSTQSAATDQVFLYQHSIGKYETYDGRWIRQYQPFSYGYYPPNLPDKGKQADPGTAIVRLKLRGSIFNEHGPAGDSGLVSMPLIIPPVKNKTYDFFWTLFTSIWKQAEDALAGAQRIIIVGYSFPRTDTRSDSLFKGAMLRRSHPPLVSVLDPSPERAIEKLVLDFGIPASNIKCRKDYFSETFPLRTLL